MTSDNVVDFMLIISTNAINVILHLKKLDFSFGHIFVVRSFGIFGYTKERRHVYGQ